MTDARLDPLDGVTVYGLPRSHWHCYFGTFEWEGVRPASMREQLTRMLTLVRAQPPVADPPHWFFTGSFGLGKTHLGVAAYRSVADQHGTILATWLNVPNFCDLVKKSYGEDGSDPWRQVEEATRLVVLDDLLGRQFTAHEHAQVLYRLIDTVYRNNAALLVTMNQDVNELFNVLPGHEVSRLLASHVVFPITSMKGDRRIHR